jgi:hypothetical protein
VSKEQVVMDDAETHMMMMVRIKGEAGEQGSV